jgi:exodeoxyribonuclease VII large subunit
MTDRNNNPLTVGQLNRRAKQLLEGHFPQVWVEAEISNFAAPSSGHWYFTLKDQQAQVRCAMFRGYNSRLRFTPNSGDQVLVRAKLSLYEARGDYQLIVEHMEPAGAGALARAFEELKFRLSQEGLFNSELKKPLPALPQHIAVITSPTGAAIHDILTVLKRRFPAIPVTVIPVAVQGEQAAPEIARAIAIANHQVTIGQADYDVIIAGRGGGSLEDLWAFNEELVARAIVASELPVVSAVGHEVDFSIADFVADARAATPSQAAELLSPDQNEWLSRLQGYEILLDQAMTRLIKDKQLEVKLLRSQLVHPGSRLQEFSQRLDELEMRLDKGFKHQLQQQQHSLQLLQLRLQQCLPREQINQLHELSSHLYQRLQLAISKQLDSCRQQLSSSAQLLNVVSPLATLERGYSIAFDADNNIIRSTKALKPGDRIKTRLSAGSLTSEVIDVSDH